MSHQDLNTVSPALDSGPNHNGKNRLKAVIADLIRYGLPFLISGLLIWWFFSRIDFSNMMGIIREGVDYWWIVAMMLITTLSHVVRAIRWGLQLDGVGIRATLLELCVSIFGTYALNLIVPRLGEIWRCVYISRRRKASLSLVLGTMVGDRASDAVVVLALVGVMIAVAHSYFTAFMEHYEFGRKLVEIVGNPWLYACVAGIIGLVVLSFYLFRKHRFMIKMMQNLRNVWGGFVALFHLRQKWEFTWLTLGIWVCYFSETYVTFLAFPFTRETFFTGAMAYGFLPGIVIFVFGSLSMAVPSNGGLGAWNIAVMFGLTLFGISATEGAAFAMLMWSAQSLMLIMLGIFCIICITVTDRIAARKRAAVLKS